MHLNADVSHFNSMCYDCSAEIVDTKVESVIMLCNRRAEPLGTCFKLVHSVVLFNISYSMLAFFVLVWCVSTEGWCVLACTFSTFNHCFVALGYFYFILVASRNSPANWCSLYSITHRLGGKWTPQYI